MNRFEQEISELFTPGSFPLNPQHCVHDLLGKKKIILYGAGDGFVTFSVFVLRKYGLKAHAVLDRKLKSGGVYAGIPALSPFDYTPTDEEKQDGVAVITVGTAGYQKEIFDYLSRLGFQNIVLASDIYEYHLLHPSADLLEEGFDYYLNRKERILECLELFYDDLSREVYTRCLQTHMQRKPAPIPHRDLNEQYFPRDIRLSKDYSRFINCGAYNGDTVLRVNSLYGKIDALACFEPDPDNFQELIQNLSHKHGEIARSVVIFPCGVYSHDERMPFASGDRINSKISGEGDSMVQCVALDHVLPGFMPTFMSMDIEGVELDALKGSENLIKESRPDLAVCVYHAPNHMWDIPLYLESLQLGYRFYLRNYTSFISETVLYATT
jgi:FkbM family methyltransferase